MRYLFISRWFLVVWCACALPASAEDLTLTFQTLASRIEAGQRLELTLDAYNPSRSADVTADLWVAVEIAGQFYFWPSWSPEPEKAESVSVRRRTTMTWELLGFDYVTAFPSPVTLNWYAIAIDGATGVLRSDLVSQRIDFLTTPVPLDEQFVNARFDLGAMGGDFFAIPFPSNLRLTETGEVDVSSFPNPGNNFFVSMVRDMATDERDGFALNTMCHIQFSGSMATGMYFDNGEALAPENPLLCIVNVDENSPEYGKKYPLLARYFDRGDDYLGDGHVLTVTPQWGDTLLPHTIYAVILYSGLMDTHLRPVGSPDSFRRALADAARSEEEHRAAESLTPLRRYMERQGIHLSDVTMGSVFTTWDPSGAFQNYYNQAVDSYWADLNTAFRVYRVEPGYVILEGFVNLPQFQRGTPPYADEGLIDVDRDGRIRQTRTEKIKVVLTIPRKKVPPGGFPLVFYVHGSGGEPIDLPDRGTKLAPNTSNVKGEGPARYLADAGCAGVAISMPLNPERVPGAGSFDYVNLFNFRSAIGNFRQGTMELGMMRKFMEALVLPPEIVPTGEAGTTPITFDREHFGVMGQSMGAMYTSFFSALEPSIKVAIPTGAGGFWTLMMMYITELPGRAILNVVFGINNPDLDEFHPILSMGQMALEAVDPVVMVPHVMRRPLPGNKPKSVYYPAGYIDHYFFPPVISAYACSMGLPLAGTVVDPQLGVDLARTGVREFGYPVRSNVVSATGEAVTGALVQYAQDSIQHGHYVSYQLPEPKYQYRCFLSSWLKDGVPTVYEPGGLEEPCP